jgi:16S rRNA (uracil1498-N3)-methyltransferase
MIGPEGDFSLEEIQIAQNAGFRSASLGKARLRTETAAIVACHTIQLYNE